MLPILRDHKATVRRAALSLNKGYSLRSNDWAYMRYNDNSEELYDMNNDPRQFTNLAKNPDFTNQLKEMRVDLKRRLKDAGVGKNK